jgi:hypothetical protein
MAAPNRAASPSEGEMAGVPAEPESRPNSPSWEVRSVDAVVAPPARLMSMVASYENTGIFSGGFSNFFMPFAG